MKHVAGSMINAQELQKNFSANTHRSYFILLTSYFKHFVKDDLRLTLSAQVLTIPLILIHFHRISLISPLPNLLIGFILPPLTAMGLITVLASVVFRPLGQLLSYITWVPLEYIIRVVMLTSRIPLASIGF